MKYGKSAFPYLALLFIFLIGMPLANYQIQQSQQVVVEVKVKKSDVKNTQIATTNKDEKKSTTLLLTSK